MYVLSTNVRLAFVKGDTMGPTNVGVPRHQTFYVPSSSSSPFPNQVAPWFAGRNDQKCQGSSNGSQVTERSTVRGILVQKWPYLPVFPSDGSNCGALVALLQPSMGQFFLDLVGFFPRSSLFFWLVPFPDLGRLPERRERASCLVSFCNPVDYKEKSMAKKII